MAAYWLYGIIAVLIATIFLAERKYPELISNLEENILALLLAAITLVSFVQVVMRYGFNSGFGGALQLTRILFAWMILIGMSYGVKMGSHLGVDAFVRMLPKRGLRLAALFGAACTALYAIILLNADWLSIFGANGKGGAMTYWSKMFQLQLGLEDLKYPTFMVDQFGWPERVQRWVAYIILPISLALLAFRSIEAFVQIFKGERDLMIAGHEAEDLVAENKDALKEAN